MTVGASCAVGRCQDSAGDAPRFEELTVEWPGDVRDHTRTLAARAFV